MEKKKTVSKYSLLLLIVFLLSTIGLFVFQYRFSDAVLSLKEEELHVLVAKTPKQWYRGLGKRETTQPYDGMIFLFPFTDRHGIVMRDMQFAIDIVWIAEGKVVDIAPNVSHQAEDGTENSLVYRPRKPSTVVLELPAGWAQGHDLQIGDKVRVVSE